MSEVKPLLPKVWCIDTCISCHLWERLLLVIYFWRKQFLSLDLVQVPWYYTCLLETFNHILCLTYPHVCFFKHFHDPIFVETFANILHVPLSQFFLICTLDGTHQHKVQQLDNMGRIRVEGIQDYSIFSAKFRSFNRQMNLSAINQKEYWFYYLPSDYALFEPRLEPFCE